LPIDDIEKKILVTGGAGDIGSRLVQALLDRGIRAKILDCQYGPFKGKKDPNLEFVKIGKDELHGGMANSETVKQAITDVEVVYHLAINWDGHSWKPHKTKEDLKKAILQSIKSL
jgi:nucleoside-diphosphate-sugar epimerase